MSRIYNLLLNAKSPLTASKIKHNLLGKVQVSSDMVSCVYNHNYSGG